MSFLVNRKSITNESTPLLEEPEKDSTPLLEEAEKEGLKIVHKIPSDGSNVKLKKEGNILLVYLDLTQAISQIPYTKL